MERKIARWESRSGKHWVELFYNPAFKLADGRTVVDAHYCAPGCGGSVVANTESEAIDALQSRVGAGYFQPDANKTPMHRVAL